MHSFISVLNFLICSPGSCKLGFHSKLGYKRHPSNSDTPTQPLFAARRDWDHPENPGDDAQIPNAQVLKPPWPPAPMGMIPPGMEGSLWKDSGWEFATAGKCGNVSWVGRAVEVGASALMVFNKADFASKFKA